MNLIKFSEWLKIRENMMPTPGKLTPGQQVAQDATADALKKMQLKPGEKITDVLNKPQGQKQLLQKANQYAKSKGLPLNLGAAASTMDASGIAPNQKGGGNV